MLFPAKTQNHLQKNEKDKAAETKPSENTAVKFVFHFVNGCSERMKGNLKEAQEHFMVCKALQPQNPAVYY